MNDTVCTDQELDSMFSVFENSQVARAFWEMLDVEDGFVAQYPNLPRAGRTARRPKDFAKQALSSNNYELT